MYKKNFSKKTNFYVQKYICIRIFVDYKVIDLTNGNKQHPHKVISSHLDVSKKYLQHRKRCQPGRLKPFLDFVELVKYFCSVVSHGGTI